jgi:hypothetical protein
MKSRYCRDSLAKFKERLVKLKDVEGHKKLVDAWITALKIMMTGR